MEIQALEQQKRPFLGRLTPTSRDIFKILILLYFLLAFLIFKNEVTTLWELFFKLANSEVRKPQNFLEPIETFFHNHIMRLKFD